MLTRRLTLLLLLVLGVTGLYARTATPAYADEGSSITFPAVTQPETELGQDDETRIPFCGFAQNRVRRPAENRPALSATLCEEGMAGPYPCDDVDLMAFMPLNTIGGGGPQGILASSLWGWTDPDTNREYALVGLENSTAFVDITDAEAPVHLGNLPTHTGQSIWRELKVYNNHAFIVSDNNGNHGIQVFDLTQLRNVPTPPQTFSETAHYGQVGSVHNIVINEQSGFAYAVGADVCNGGLHMVNIQNPANPTYAGCFGTDGYTHDAQCVIYNGPDAEHQGSEICIASNEDTVTVVDVSDKANPVQLARKGYPTAGYTHQSWLTENQEYMVLDDELDEWASGGNTRTYLWDMRDLDEPNLIGAYTGATDSIDHNQYVKGNYAYQANYTSGMAVLDVSDIANGNVTPYGYFDIYPESNDAEFAAAWNVFPYFDSGNVIISGIEQGLFIVRPNLPAPPTAVEIGNLSTNAPVSALPLIAGSVLLAMAALGFVMRKVK